jgi:hypothetical protein
MERRRNFPFVGRVSCLGLGVVLVLLGGCSSLKVQESWQSPAKPKAPYRTLLLVGIANDRNVRTLFENIVADELGRTGVTALASHNYVKDLDKANQDDIIAAVRAVGADAVITARPVSIGDTTVTQQGVPTGGVYGTTGNGFYSLPGNDTFYQAILQTNLYDAKTTQLVWTATIKTYDADNKVRICRELGRLFAELLRRDGFL